MHKLSHGPPISIPQLRRIWINAPVAAGRPRKHAHWGGAESLRLPTTRESQNGRFVEELLNLLIPTLHPSTDHDRQEPVGSLGKLSNQS